MKEVKKIYFNENTDVYETWLVIELEDGTKLAQCSSDAVRPFRKIK